MNSNNDKIDTRLTSNVKRCVARTSIQDDGAEESTRPSSAPPNPGAMKSTGVSGKTKPAGDKSPTTKTGIKLVKAGIMKRLAPSNPSPYVTTTTAPKNTAAAKTLTAKTTAAKTTTTSSSRLTSNVKRCVARTSIHDNGAKESTKPTATIPSSTKARETESTKAATGGTKPKITAESEVQKTGAIRKRLPLSSVTQKTGQTTSESISASRPRAALRASTAGAVTKKTTLALPKKVIKPKTAMSQSPSKLIQTTGSTSSKSAEKKNPETENKTEGRDESNK